MFYFMNKKRPGRPSAIDDEGNPLNLSPTNISLPINLKRDLDEIGVNRSELIRTLLQDWVDHYYGLKTKTSIDRRVGKERQSDLLDANKVLQEKLDDVRKEHYDLLKGICEITDGQNVYGSGW